jgi:hypothetical protein
MLAGRTVIPRTSCTGWLGHARNGPATALCKEHRKLAFDLLRAALCAGERHIRLAHRPQDFKLGLAVQADIFVNGHGTSLAWENYTETDILRDRLFAVNLSPELPAMQEGFHVGWNAAEASFHPYAGGLNLSAGVGSRYCHRSTSV